MANVVLGLLIIVGPQTIYTLNKLFQEGVSLFYSASLGALRSALARLLDENLVSVTESHDRGRLKKTYTVTAAGRASFEQWMLSAVDDRQLDVGALSRLYFLGALSRTSDRVTVLERIQERAAADHERLQKLAGFVDSVDVPDELRDLARFQRQTLEYGLRVHTLASEFFAELADEERTTASAG